MHKFKWPLIGALVAVGTLYVGSFTHHQFRDTITKNFTDQQALFAHSMEFAIQDHLLEEEQDLKNTIRTLSSSGDPIEGARKAFAALYATHLDDYDSVSTHDARGRLLAWIPSDPEPNAAIVTHLEKAISRNGSPFRSFLSEPFFPVDSGPYVHLVVPFTLPGREETVFAAAGINLAGYLTSHFPAWHGKRMGFILSDDDGDVLALLNTSHDMDTDMLPGNIMSLDSKCLGCHGKHDFQDVWRAIRQEQVVHWRYASPGSELEKNRTTLPFSIFNETWAITVLSPFESIQRAIDRNLLVSLALTGIALLLVGLISYFSLKASSYEKLAAAAKALHESEDALHTYAWRLEEANRLKDLFTDIVRHDLMSAVSTVKGYAGLLSEGEHEEGRREMFAAMEGALAKLRDVIECSATISRLEEGSLGTSSLDVSDILQRSLGRVSSLSGEKGTAFDVDMPDELLFPTSPLLEEVFVNLLSNAVKYSPPRSRVEVRLGLTAEGLIFSVKDWGEGIADQHKDLIFERLERLDKKGIKGSGLGLAIVRRIVTLHGGRVSVADNPEGGSVFTVRVPASAQGAPGLPPRAFSATDGYS